MAALVPGPDFDLQTFAHHCCSELPSYAVPLFVRLLPKLEVTSTFKYQKVQLREQGCDPANFKDAIFVLDRFNHTYITLTREKYDEICRLGSKL